MVPYWEMIPFVLLAYAVAIWLIARTYFLLRASGRQWKQRREQ